MSLGELWHQITSAVSEGVLPDLGAWSYVILVLLVFVEGPAATLVAATMAAAGILRADLVFLFSVIANFLADVFWYLVGFSAGQGGRVSRLGWLQRRMAQIESVEQALHGRAAQMYLLTKLSLGLLTIPVLIASGLARVPWLRLFVVSIVVEPLWNGLLVLAGYRLGDSVAEMERELRIVAIGGSVLIFVVLLLLYRRMFARLFQMTKGDAKPHTDAN
jgi:membrane protein DedA with SNARE-associated domain